jgi:N-methylhydantoinase A
VTGAALPGGAAVGLAIDTGGTFTDLVVDIDGTLRLYKAATTPEDPTRGVLDVLAIAAEGLGVDVDRLLGQATLLVHGTTHAINALVTRTTARTALLTTAGHPDVLLFREGGRSDPFDFSVPYPEPLVPRALTYEVPERIAADGEILVALDEEAVAGLLDRVADAGVEAIAVCLLWSIVEPAHERRVGELIAERLPGVPVTLSHELNPTVREYRRASSACIDASLKPLMSSYFARLESRLQQAGFGGRLLIVTSQGGMLDAADVAAAPVHAINSGPAMAPVAGRHYAAEDTGRRTAIIADSGGTTFDVSLVRDGRIPRTSETWLGPQYQGHITGFPSVDVTSVGAGGGSIASVDEAGLLHVGPSSAGSEPGPACYGRGGTAPTVTDASLVLGHVDPDYFLGGRMGLDVAAATAALTRDVADPLGLSPEEAALAVLRIATENMVGAVEELTINQGIDPREAVLVGGGGAAGLNLVAIARRLGCPEALLPETGAALSAAGALLSDLSADFARTAVTRTDHYDRARVDEVLDELAARCERFARRAGAVGEAQIEYAFDGRYLRQNWDLETTLPAGRAAGADEVAAAFHAMHERVFAISEPDAPVQVTTWRARVRCRVSDSTGRRLAAEDSAAARASRSALFLDGCRHDAAVVELSDLEEGGTLDGPAIVESPFTTLVLDPGARLRRTASGSLLIDPDVEASS